ncbi:MAG: hypothetical protein ACREDO_00510 [Methyloceanibacter sp.]
MRIASGVAFIATGIILAGCETLEGLAGLAPTIDQINAPAQPAPAPVIVTARVDPRGWTNHQIYFRHSATLAGLASDSGELEEPSCTPIAGSSALNCSASVGGVPAGQRFYQWYIDYWLPDGSQNDAATIDRPVPPGELELTGGGTPPPPPPVTGGEEGGPPPTAAPVIISPLDGAVCVGNPVGNTATVTFDFEEVENARGGSGEYQVEIRRQDAPTCIPNWSEPGSGFDNYPECWIADTNTHFHAESLDQNTFYRWRARGSDVTVDPIASGPYTAFQTFKTAGPPTAPPSFTAPTEGQVITLPAGVVGQSFTASWSPPECEPASFNLQVFRNDGPANPVVTGTGNSATFGIQRNSSYRLRLIQHTATGDAPTAEVNFSVAP